MMPAEVLHPLLKGSGPFIPVSLTWVSAVKIKGKLVVGIMLKPENTCQGEIKFFKMLKVPALMLTDHFSHFILQAQGIVPQKVFYLHKIYKVMEQCLLQRKLHLFQDIIFITRKELSKHSVEGFDKN